MTHLGPGGEATPSILQPFPQPGAREEKEEKTKLCYFTSEILVYHALMKVSVSLLRMNKINPVLSLFWVLLFFSYTFFDQMKILKLKDEDNFDIWVGLTKWTGPMQQR